MKNAKKVLVLLLCAVLLVSATIAGTVAYLTSQQTVTNTFTVGNVTIELKEYKMNPTTGMLEDNDSNTNGVQTVLGKAGEGINNIKVIPGRKIEKQPVVIVGENSENCWLFVKVEGEALTAGTFTCADGWSAVTNDDGWYQYFEAATPKTDGYKVFENFTFADLSNEDVAKLNDATIEITAYAVQSEGVSQDVAFNTAKGLANSTNP